MTRHKRHPRLSDHERAAMIAAATELHRQLIRHCCSLSPTGDDYKALSGLNDAIVRTITALSGQEPDWMRVSASTA